jgi:hypothetical protein
MRTIVLSLCLSMISFIVIAQNAGKVKKTPDPVAEFAGKSEGTIDKQSAVYALEITAQIKSFQYEADFKVVSFKFIYFKGWFVSELQGKGNMVTKEMTNIINGLTPGSKFGFEDIKAVGPDGKERILNTIILKIN